MPLKIEHNPATTAPSPAQVVKIRLAATKAGLTPELSDLLMQVDPDAVPDTAKQLPAILRALTAAFGGVMDQAEAGTAGLAELRELLGEPDTTPDNLRAKAIARADAIMEARPAEPPMLGARVGRSFDDGPGWRAKMTAALDKRLDPKGTAEVRGIEAATLSEIAMMCVRKAGLHASTPADAIRMAAHTTSDFPLILDGAIGNQVARRIEVIQPAIRRAAHLMRRDDYRQGRSLHLSATSKPQEIREGGEINFVTADEKGELLPKLRDFGAGMNVTNQALANDMTGAALLNDIARNMAEGAVATMRDVLLEPLLAASGAGQTMADGLAYFHASHGNLAASGAAINVTSLALARTAMRRQKGLKGEILGVEPWALVVPPELETAAQQVVADLAATAVADVNPFAGTLEIIVEPGLTSTTAWYLAADPSRFDGLAYSFLEGQTAPRVESRPAWSTLGLELRLVWALDAKLIQTATWYRNPGA